MPAVDISNSMSSDLLEMRRVFVYGTLRRGQSNDIARFAGGGDAPRFEGFAQINGTMFDLGAYPGVVLGGSSPIMGEVYRVTPQVEERLDVLEELLPEPTGEYFKRDISVNLSSLPDGTPVMGRSVQCFVYEINRQRITDAPEITHGDWVRFVREERFD